MKRPNFNKLDVFPIIWILVLIVFHLVPKRSFNLYFQNTALFFSIILFGPILTLYALISKKEFVSKMRFWIYFMLGTVWIMAIISLVILGVYYGEFV